MNTTDLKRSAAQLLTLAAFVLFLAILPTPAMPEESPAVPLTVIRDVRLFDGERLHEKVSVIIREGRIEAVGPKLESPPGALVVDGRDKTLLPGLIDSHTHTFGDARRDALRFGVTTAIDMFTDHRTIAAAREQRTSTAATERADLYSAGTLVTAAGGHGTQFGLAIETFTPGDDPLAFIDARIAEGSDFIKIVLEDGAAHGRSIPSLTGEDVAALITAAKKRGRLAVVHVSTLATAKMAIAAGADGLAHLFWEPLDDDFIEQVRSRGAFIIPTLSVLESFSGGRRGSNLVADDRIGPFLSREQKGSLERTIPAAADDPRLKVALENTRRLHAAGVPILAGTDAPNPGTAHGVSMLGELELLVEAGLTPLQAIRSATSRPAARFSIPERGCVTAGCRADLLLIDGNPFAGIAAMRNIVAVWKNGLRVAREIPSAAAAPTITPGLISDFDSGTVDARFGAGWQATTDQMMGGKSEAELSWLEEGAGDSAGALRVEGVVRAGGPVTWAGAMFFPAEQMMAPVNAAAARELHFTVRGTAKTVDVMLFSEGTPGRPVTLSVPLQRDWQRVRLELGDFRGVDPASLQAIGWVVSGEAGAFRFDLDDVRLTPGE